MNRVDKPHVVHVIDELPPDGAERLIVDVLQNRSDRFRYSVLCIVAGGQMVDELRAIGVPVTILNRKRGLDLGTVPALVRWYKQERVDVVHTHLYAADSYGRAAALLAGVRGRFSTRHNTNAWGSRGRRAIAWLLGRASHKVIGCGEAVGGFLTDVEGLPADKVTVIANGINLRRFDGVDRGALRRELGVADSTVVMGVIGRLHEQKGHADLLIALEALNRTHPDFVCVLAGSGELKDKIEADARARGLESKVRLLGQRKDIPNVLAGLDLFVMPSLWEGLPMAMLEAMALATPVLSTNVGSIPSVIDDGQDGLLVPPAQPERLTAALQKLMADPAWRRQLGEAGKATVVAHFNAAHTAAAYEALYLESLGRPVA
ncbi:MAG: hypothetical protein RLZZ618_4062 [Pseudomonadota bacterium]|jgi:glycosyltransferase involved in cell wall biosynthesis